MGAMSDGADQPAQWVECVEDEGYQFDLSLHKRYRVIPDPDGAEVGLVRIVDETGEDYLYPRSMFAAAESQPAPGEMLSAS